jgi:hypothetical protein
MPDLFGGVCAQVFDMLTDGVFEVYMDDWILAEYDSVLRRPHLARMPRVAVLRNPAIGGCLLACSEGAVRASEQPAAGGDSASPRISLTLIYKFLHYLINN